MAIAQTSNNQEETPPERMNRCREERISNSKDESPPRTIPGRLKRTKRRFEE